MDTMTDKLAQADLAMQKAAAYVEATQPLLDAQNELRDKFTKRAHSVVGGLVARGVIKKAKSNALIDKLTGDYTAALDLVEKVAEYIKPPSLGDTSDVKVASHTNLDAFERLALTGSASGQVANSGMVD